GVEGAAAEADHVVVQHVGGNVVAPTRYEVLRGPRLCCSDLEDLRAGLYPALEEAREGVLVRRPHGVVPAEVAADEGEGGLDPLLGLVPLLVPRLLDPAFDLALLLADPCQTVAEHERHASLDPIGLSAREALECSLLHLLGIAVGLDGAAAHG